MNLGQIGAGLVVTLLPGLAVLIWLRYPGRDLPAYLADAVGLSISLTALGGLVFFLIGIAPGALGTAFAYGVCLATLAAALIYQGLPRYDRRSLWASLAGLLAGALALGALIWFRLYQARGLALPNWVDSVHHTLIVRLILETGGLPANFLPYLDAPFSYLYGFHLITAAFAIWSQLPAEQAVLLYGQALNGLISLGMYRLGRALGLDWRGAALAGLLTGFVFQLPAYYLTWGRYTLSAGVVVLLMAMATALELRANPNNRRLGLQLALLTAGVCLTHYLATLMLLIFFALLGLEGAITAARKRSLRAAPWQLAGWALAGGLAALPWVVRTLMDNAAQVRVSGLVTTVKAGDWGYLINLLGPRYDHILMVMAAVGLLFALRKGRLAIFNLWSLALLFLAQPFATRLGPFRPDLYVIVLFIPAGIYLAAMLADGADALARVSRRGWSGPAALGLACALLLAWGVSETRDVVNPATIIATRADLHALEWVQANTPADARFYINPAPWLGTVYRGADGGYWLMPLTGRFSLVPPVYYAYQPPAVALEVQGWITAAMSVKDCGPEFWTIASQADLGYVYLREGRGSLQPAALDICPRLRLVYREEGVSIYEILRVQ